MTPEATAKLLLATARRCWKSNLVGNPCLNTEQRFERMSNPQIGDWVFEQSTSYIPSPAMCKIGILQKVANEEINSAEWDIKRDGPIPTETVFYIKSIDGKEHRWVNAEMIAFAWEGEPKYY